MDGGESIAGSFRDPSGVIFRKDGQVYRQVNARYKKDYDCLIGSGLYKNLAENGLLIPHEEHNPGQALPEAVYKVIKPEAIPFISYPYEWSFSQLKDAALLTLRIQKRALEFGMSLKDASAYNIQFRQCRPILIDTLSFEKFREGEPWIAYRQFCQHFLAPLALESLKDLRLGQLSRVHIDGIPLDLASALLPLSAYFRLSILFHIKIHAACQRYFEDKAAGKGGRRMSRQAFMALIDNLESAVRNLKRRPERTTWSGYYNRTNYADGALDRKKEVVAGFLDIIRPEMVWDLGANTGLFSRIAGEKGICTISFDADPVCVEQNYSECVTKGEKNVLPLLLDITNPSPAIGWENSERASLMERGPADTVLALALVHHLAVSNNLPLDRIAGFFNKICKRLIIEFVPKNDSQVQRLLASREDIFVDYSQRNFEGAFTKFFAIDAAVKIGGTERTLYRLSKK